MRKDVTQQATTVVSLTSDSIHTGWYLRFEFGSLRGVVLRGRKNSSLPGGTNCLAI